MSLVAQYKELLIFMFTIIVGIIFVVSAPGEVNTLNTASSFRMYVKAIAGFVLILTGIFLAISKLW